LCSDLGCNKSDRKGTRTFGAWVDMWNDGACGACSVGMARVNFIRNDHYRLQRLGAPRLAVFAQSWSPATKGVLAISQTVKRERPARLRLCCNGQNGAVGRY
jgi:hypothetical protein